MELESIECPLAIERFSPYVALVRLSAAWFECYRGKQNDKKRAYKTSRNQFLRGKRQHPNWVEIRHQTVQLVRNGLGARECFQDLGQA